MSNVKDIKVRSVPILLGGKKEKLIFDFNSYALLEDVYGTMELAFEALEKGSVRAIRDLIWAGLSHTYLDELTDEMTITKVAIGKRLALSDLEVIADKLNLAIELSSPDRKEEDSEEVKALDVASPEVGK